MSDVTINEIVGSVPNSAVEQASKDSSKSESHGDVLPDSHRVGRGEMSALAVTRLMGIATSAELKTLEGRIDLITTKLMLLTSKIERLLGEIESLPRGSDIDRIEIQLSKILDIVKSTN